MFSFTEDQAEIKNMAKEFSKKFLVPTVAERDEKAEFSRTIFDEMGKTGFTGIEPLYFFGECFVCRY